MLTLALLTQIEQVPPMTDLSTSVYCIALERNMAKWKNKKKNVVARLSVEAEYRAMAKSTTKLEWLKHLLGELGFQVCVSTDLWCDNQATIHIATNPSMSRLNTLKKNVTMFEKR